MWPFSKRIKSEIAGRVISVKVGEARIRVTVLAPNGDTHTHFMSRVRTKLGRKVRKGTALGYK